MVFEIVRLNALPSEKRFAYRLCAGIAPFQLLHKKLNSSFIFPVDFKLAIKETHNRRDELSGAQQQITSSKCFYSPTAAIFYTIFFQRRKRFASFLFCSVYPLDEVDTILAVKNTGFQIR
jgi:hypothetical protein